MRDAVITGFEEVKRMGLVVGQFGLEIQVNGIECREIMQVALAKKKISQAFVPGQTEIG